MGRLVVLITYEAPAMVEVGGFAELTRLTGIGWTIDSFMGAYYLP